MESKLGNDCPCSTERDRKDDVTVLFPAFLFCVCDIKKN